MTVWGRDEDWTEAERSVMEGLAAYDLTDVYRDVNGYGDNAYSWVAKNQGSEFPRRFDHVFASQALHATEATYLHKYDDLSDHTPLEVVFTPQDGLREEAEVIDCGTFSPSGNRTVEASSPSMSNDRLNYEDDVRTVDPDANYRRGRFKVGWSNAVDGTEMDEEVLNNSLGRTLDGGSANYSVILRRISRKSCTSGVSNNNWMILADLDFLYRRD